MIYLREFETQAAYTAAQSSLILPNVSLITENNKVEYNPLTPPTPRMDIITYTASSKLREGSDEGDFNPNVFRGANNMQLTMVSHTYDNGVGTITFDNDIEVIGEDWTAAFYSCTDVTSITIPDSVTTIGNGTFFGCSSLTSINIPNSVSDIGWGAFCGCDNLDNTTLNTILAIQPGANMCD